MDIYKLNWTSLQNSIFRLLCFYVGEKVNQREIAGMLKVSPTAVANALLNLEKEKIIIREKQKNINLFLIELNRDSERVIQLKRTENLRILYDSGLNEFLEEKFPGDTIILFGSYSLGEDTKKSDIDLAIIGTKGKEINTEKFDKILKKEIRINFYKNWKEIHKDLKNNILRGIVLAGGIDL